MKKLDVPFKFQKVDQGCLLACLEMVLNYFHKKDYQKLINDLSCDKFGYDILEVSQNLIANNYKIEVGGFDSDIFKQKKAAFTLTDLEKIYQKEELTKYPKQDLKALIKFAKKYSEQLNIGYKDLDFLKQKIDQGLPVIINLSARTLGVEIEEAIHSVVLIGYDQKGFSILNPPKRGEEYVKNKDLKFFWYDASQYYLVIKK
jgi:uncharacterized protein YvpB